MKILNGLKTLSSRLKTYFNPCPKERMGYTCHHREYLNGKKECDE